MSTFYQTNYAKFAAAIAPYFYDDYEEEVSNTKRGRKFHKNLDFAVRAKIQEEIKRDKEEQDKEELIKELLGDVEPSEDEVLWNLPFNTEMACSMCRQKEYHARAFIMSGHDHGLTHIGEEKTIRIQNDCECGCCCSCFDQKERVKLNVRDMRLKGKVCAVCDDCVYFSGKSIEKYTLYQWCFICYIANMCPNCDNPARPGNQTMYCNYGETEVECKSCEHKFYPKNSTLEQYDHCESWKNGRA